jgi:excisionase family DNA binding protein
METVQGDIIMSTREVMTPQQVAEYLQLHLDTVYRYIREGKLVASRFGRQYRIPKRNVDLLLLATSSAGPAQPRLFLREQIEEWVTEDELDEEPRRIGEWLLNGLAQRQSADLADSDDESSKDDSCQLGKKQHPC